MMSEKSEVKIEANGNDDNEPAPPGIEDNQDIVIAADLNFAKKERVPPENVSEWSSLHHLQHCFISSTDYTIVDECGAVKFADKNVEFPFDEVTIFGYL